MRDLLLILFSMMVGHIIFLSIALLSNHRHAGNYMLGFILILFAIRVGKSVLTLAFPEEALWLSTIGLAAMAALGPLLHLYCLHLFSWDRFKISLLHFLPMLLCCFAWSWSVVNPAYYVITLQMGIYLIVTVRHLFLQRETYRTDNVRWKWSIGVTVASGIIWFSFLAQILIYVPLLYFINVGVSVVLLYGLSLWAGKQNNLFVGFLKRKNETEETHTELGKKIKKLMEDEEIFIDPALSLSLLSKKLNEQPYVVSKCINSFFQKSFPELLASYRIEKSKQLLLSSLNKTHSIEGIAYESGFSTLSAFYNSFKKINGVTPSQFRKNAEAKNMRVA